MSNCKCRKPDLSKHLEGVMSHAGSHVCLHMLRCDSAFPLTIACLLTTEQPSLMPCKFAQGCKCTHAATFQEDLPPPPPPSGRESVKETPAERAERMRREDIRKERHRERERERRLEAKDAHGFKKSKLTRDRDRDVSEKMALGQVSCLLIYFPSRVCFSSCSSGCISTFHHSKVL